MSRDKILISPGQGLLILIDNYQKKLQTNIETNMYGSNFKQIQEDINLEIHKLQTIYLRGVHSVNEGRQLARYLRELPDEYAVVTTVAAINDDPVRRYFETHLSYETLKSKIDLFDDELINKFNAFYQDVFVNIDEGTKQRIIHFDTAQPIFNQYYQLPKILSMITTRVEEIEPAMLPKVRLLTEELLLQRQALYDKFTQKSLNEFKNLTKALETIAGKVHSLTIRNYVSNFYNERITAFNDFYEGEHFNIMFTLVRKLMLKRTICLAGDIDIIFERYTQSMKQFHEEHRNDLLMSTTFNQLKEIVCSQLLETDETKLEEQESCTIKYDAHLVEFTTTLESFLSDFNGVMPQNIPYSEYIDLLAKIEQGYIAQEFSMENQNKLYKIAKYIVNVNLYCTSSSYKNLVDAYLPIYDDEIGIYSSKKRGRADIIFNVDMKIHRHFDIYHSAAYGIMRNRNPLSQGDIAYSVLPIPYFKPFEKYTYKRDSFWVERNFAKATLPFATSISGTMLVVLKALVQILTESSELILSTYDCAQQINTNLRNLLVIIISLMNYHSGGHTLYEFIAPIALPEVQALFADIKMIASEEGESPRFISSPNFVGVNLDNVNLESMFMHGNETAFNQAIQDSIAYNNKIIINQKIKTNLLRQKKIIEILAPFMVGYLENSNLSSGIVFMCAALQHGKIDRLIDSGELNFSEIENLHQGVPDVIENLSQNTNNAPVRMKKTDFPIDLERSNLYEFQELIKPYIENGIPEAFIVSMTPNESIDSIKPYAERIVRLEVILSQMYDSIEHEDIDSVYALSKEFKAYISWSATDELKIFCTELYEISQQLFQNPISVSTKYI